MSASIDVATRGLRSTATVGLGQRLRSTGVWIAAAVIVLLTVIATMVMTGEQEPNEPLHYDSTAGDGTKALVETLRTHGVSVTTTDDLATARAGAAQPDTTLLIPANADALSPGDAAGLRAALLRGGNGLVLVAPGPQVSALSDRIVLADDASPLAAPEQESQPDCALPAARAAGSVATGTVEYTERSPGTQGITVCYPFSGPGVVDADDNRGQLLVDAGDEVPVTVLGNPEWVTNSGIVEEGHASLVLSTLSQTSQLIVYRPEAAAAGPAAPSALDFLPRWLGAGALWLIPCALVGLLVVSRRFGPLAVERLPVIVPSIETVRGRAALSARSHDRAGALDTLRTASLLRIAGKLALPPQARLGDILAEVSARTGRDPVQIDAVFVSTVPRTDAQLHAIAEQLTLIESEITRT